MRFDNYLALPAGDITVNQSSIPIDSSNLVAASVMVIVATGSSPSGAVKVQASNQPGNTLPVNMVWCDIASQTVTISATGQLLIPKFDVCYQWLRVVYTKTSGSGTFTAYFQGIGF